MPPNYNRNASRAAAPSSPALSTSSAGASPPKAKSKARAFAGAKPAKHAAPPVASDDGLSDGEQSEACASESGETQAMIVALIEAAKRKQKKEAAVVDKKAAEARTEALRKAEEAIKAARARAEAEMTTAEKACHAKIAAEAKRSRQEVDTFSNEVDGLIAEAHTEHKKLKVSRHPPPTTPAQSSAH